MGPDEDGSDNEEIGPDEDGSENDEIGPPEGGSNDNNTGPSEYSFDNDVRGPGEEASDNDERGPDEDGSDNDVTGFNNEDSIEDDAFKDDAALSLRIRHCCVPVRRIFCEDRTSRPTGRRKAECLSQEFLRKSLCSNVKDEGDFG